MPKKKEIEKRAVLHPGRTAQTDGIRYSLFAPPWYPMLPSVTKSTPCFELYNIGALWSRRENNFIDKVYISDKNAPCFRPSFTKDGASAHSVRGPERAARNAFSGMGLA